MGGFPVTVSADAFFWATKWIVSKIIWGEWDFPGNRILLSGEIHTTRDEVSPTPDADMAENGISEQFLEHGEAD